MYCVSVSYKSANIELRKRLMFNEDKIKKITLDLKYSGLVSECVMLCTCNRTEIYFCGEKGSEDEVVSAIADNSGIDKILLSKHLLFFCGDNSIIHLFKVACGIDSMVIGEDEILGQTKSAYFFAKENNTVDHRLNMIFQSAIACAKKIKTETDLSKTSVSVATLAANKAADFGEKVNVLVIGASGKIGSTVLKNLVSHKNVNICATLRHYNQFGTKFIENSGINTIDYKNRYEYIHNFDCIISATTSPHYTITLCDLKNNLADERKRLFIDLAVPPDIDDSIIKLKGIQLINIDYFERLAKENNQIKINSVDAAESIIKSSVDTLLKDLIFHDFLPRLGKVKKGLANKSLEELIYRMKSDTCADEFSAFINVLKTFERQE